MAIVGPIIATIIKWMPANSRPVEQIDDILEWKREYKVNLEEEKCVKLNRNNNIKRGYSKKDIQRRIFKEGYSIKKQKLRN